MRVLRSTAVGAAFLASSTLAAQGSGAVTPKHHVKASKPATLPARNASATTPASSASSTNVPLNEFLSYDSGAKTVSLKLFSAHGSTNGGLNFNGGSNGSVTITIPAGWTVTWAFKNEDAIPHSAIVLVNKMPFPAQPQDPAIPRAYTNDVTGGLPTGQTDQTAFKASPAGQYLIVCGVPGHAPSGMWIHLDVSADAKIPTYTPK